MTLDTTPKKRRRISQGSPNAAKEDTLVLQAKSEADTPRVFASAAQDPVVGGALTARSYSDHTFGHLDITESISVLQEQVDSVKCGDMSRVEATLTAQAHTLDAIFNDFARRARHNLTDHFEEAEVLLRLALKAQSQCRTTLETLSEIKNPRQATFVRQANIAAGPQQVNNESFCTPSRTRAPAREMQSEQNELLEEQHGKRLDEGT
jgi:hypothetical protein